MKVKKIAVFGVAALMLGIGFIAMKQFAGMKELPPERPKTVSSNYVRVNPVAYREDACYPARLNSNRALTFVKGRYFAAFTVKRPG